MLLPPGGVVSGWAAMRLHGAAFCDGLGRDGTTELPVPLLLPRHLDLRCGPGAIRHRSAFEPHDTTTRVGIPVATAVRATFDAARWSGDLREAVVVIDIALAAGLCTAGELEAYARRAHAHGVVTMRRALRLSNPRTLSPEETRVRLIWVLDAGLPEPLCNWPVADSSGRRMGRPDLLCEELAVAGEFDGKDHRDRQTHRTDVAKEDAYRRVGLEVFHVVGKDIHDRELVVRRMCGAVARAKEAGRPRSWLIRSDPGQL